MHEVEAVTTKKGSPRRGRPQNATMTLTKSYRALTYRRLRRRLRVFFFALTQRPPLPKRQPGLSLPLCLPLDRTQLFAILVSFGVLEPHCNPCTPIVSNMHRNTRTRHLAMVSDGSGRGDCAPLLG